MPSTYERHTKEFAKYIAQSSKYKPFSIDAARGEGVYIWDSCGKKYIDFISSICVNNVGHRHPKVLEAIEKQMQEYLHIMVYGEFIQEPQLILAKKLCSLMPSDNYKVFFVNSGSEAIEGAVKLSRLANGRKKIISFKNSYHGSTFGAVSLLGDEEIKKNFSPLLPELQLLNYNNTNELSAIDTNTCCVVAEVIQSGGGVLEGSEKFLKALRQKCDEMGAMLIFDEIQTGCGRTGDFFAYEHHGVVPDILCLAKGLGGGMPIGCFIAQDKYMDLLDKDNKHPLLGHASTFGGHPLSCVASLASLQIIESILPSIKEKEEHIRQRLAKISVVEEVRGRGLFLGVCIDDESRTQKIVEYCLSNGLIVFWPLFNKSVVDFTPPLTISHQEIDEALDIFEKAAARV